MPPTRAPQRRQENIKKNLKGGLTIDKAIQRTREVLARPRVGVTWVQGSLDDETALVVADGDGTVHPATVIKAGPCVVVQAKTAQTDGYEAVQLRVAEQYITRFGEIAKASTTPRSTVKRSAPTRPAPSRTKSSSTPSLRRKKSTSARTS